MSSKRNVSALAVYSAKRRKRSISNPHPQLIQPSLSPNNPNEDNLDKDDDGLSVTEMSRRMLKRSRNMKNIVPGSERAKSSSLGASPIDQTLENTRPTKKSRQSVRTPLATIHEPTLNGQDIKLTKDTADMDLTDMVQVKTPAPLESANPKPIADNPEEDEETDFLSPLPTIHNAKRVIAHRRSSQSLKENKGGSALLGASEMDVDLASPFHSRPGSPDKKGTLLRPSKTLGRTRSVGTDLRRRATLRSHSRAQSPSSGTCTPAPRHPSLPGSQSKSRKENQDWFVPAQLKKPSTAAQKQRPLEIEPDTDIPFIRESSFFNGVPEACSTPVAQRRILAQPPTPGTVKDVDATPRLPLFLRNRPDVPNHGAPTLLLDEPTPRAPHQKLSSNVLGSSAFGDSIFSDDMPLTISSSNTHISPAKKATLRTYLTNKHEHSQYSEDSIFSSSIDDSASRTVRGTIVRPADPEQNEPQTIDPKLLAPPTSPTASPTSQASSDGDVLRDMFSIMGLDEDEGWDAYQSRSSGSSAISTLIDNSANANKPSKNQVKRPKYKKAPPQTESPLSSASAVGKLKRTKKPDTKKTKQTSDTKSKPTRKNRISKLLVTKSDSSDEILKSILTVKKTNDNDTKSISASKKTKMLSKPILPLTDSSDELDLFKLPSL